mgnify:CR=1 FL=1
MHNSYEISHRKGRTTIWELFTGDLVVVKSLNKDDWVWMYALARRIGQPAIVLGPVKGGLPGDEGAYVIKFISDGHTELVETEEVKLVSRRLD